MDVFDFDPLAVSGPWQWNRGVRRSQRQAVHHDTSLHEFAKAYRDGNLVDRCQRIGVITPLPDPDIPRHQAQKRIDRQVAYFDFQCGTAKRLAERLLGSEADPVDALIVNGGGNADKNQHQCQTHGGFEEKIDSRMNLHLSGHIRCNGSMSTATKTSSGIGRASSVARAKRES